MAASYRTGAIEHAGSGRTDRPRPERFTVTEDHLKLLRKMRVGWTDARWGAPAINANSPYGGANIKDDIENILGKYAGNNGVLRAIHLQTRIVMQIALSTGKFEIGTYERQADDDVTWTKI